MRRRRLALLSSICLAVSAAAPATATVIIGNALGSQLTGGVVTVTRVDSSTATATFFAVGTGASAITASFRLDVSPGDTSLATWTLTNTNPSFLPTNLITAVTIDLTLSALSLFDSGSLPSTFDSGAGVAGVTYTSGALISSSGELNPWTDASNLGDMYTATSIAFTIGLGIGGTSSWTDDTDLIPEPATGALVALGLVALGGRRSRAARPRAFRQ